jgi:hypothetical protein
MFPRGLDEKVEKSTYFHPFFSESDYKKALPQASIANNG